MGRLGRGLPPPPGHRPAAPAHGTTARITLTISLEDLRDRLDRDGLLPSGDRISAAAVRRLACDAEIIPAILGSQGQVLDVGRTQRLVTIGIWNALVLRDRHCAFPGCNRLPLACDAHHIVHWANGGKTSMDNLTLRPLQLPPSTTKDTTTRRLTVLGSTGSSRQDRDA